MTGKKTAKNCIRIKKTALLVFALVLSAIALSACSFRPGFIAKADDPGQSSGNAAVWYMDKNYTELEKRTVTLQAKDTRGAVEELIRRMREPAESIELVPPVQNYEIEEWSLSEDLVTVRLSLDYYRLDTVREALTRAALTESLCSIEGVSEVAFLCGDSALTDSRGDLVGTMSPAQIMMEDEDGRFPEQVRLHLYFADETGTRLLDTYRNVRFNSNISMERLVAEQVIKGPNSDLVRPVLNSETRVLSAYTRDSICYIDLDSAFLSQPSRVTQQTAVYALVNSLTEIPGIRKVQISVEGDTDITFMDTMSLQSPFERNLSIVAGR